MIPRLPTLLTLFLVIPAWAVQSYPPEVARYLDRRELCEHFRQEPWPEGASTADKERRQFLAGQFGRHCKGADQALRSLKAKYAKDRTVLERLESYEENIEQR